MLMAVLRRMRVNQHPTDGVSHAFLDLKAPRLRMVMACVSFVIMVLGRRRACMSGTATGAAAGALR